MKTYNKSFLRCEAFYSRFDRIGSLFSRTLVTCVLLTLSLSLCACSDDEEELIELGDNAIHVEYEEHMLDGSCSTTTEVGYEGEISVIQPVEQEETVCVHVCGAVIMPGVYEMPAGSRVVEAIYAAGGFLQNAAQDALNLANNVTDGEQIYVPTIEEIDSLKTDAAGTPGLIQIDNAVSTSPLVNNGAAGSTSTLININTADRAALMTLGGIGEAKADAIIEYRAANGPFGSTEDIMLISGIKEGLYNKIRDKICVR